MYSWHFFYYFGVQGSICIFYFSRSWPCLGSAYRPRAIFMGCSSGDSLLFSLSRIILFYLGCMVLLRLPLVPACAAWEGKRRICRTDWAPKCLLVVLVLVGVHLVCPLTTQVSLRRGMTSGPKETKKFDWLVCLLWCGPFSQGPLVSLMSLSQGGVCQDHVGKEVFWVFCLLWWGLPCWCCQSLSVSWRAREVRSQRRQRDCLDHVVCFIRIPLASAKFSWIFF